MPWYLPLYEVIIHWAATSLVVLCVATIGLLVVRRPARRRRLIETALVACLVVPAMGWVPGLPHWSIDWSSKPQQSESTKLAAVVPVQPVTQLPPTVVDVSGDLPPELAVIDPTPELEKSRPIALVPTPAKAVPVAAPFDYRLAVVGCYLTGVGAMGLWWLVAVIGLWRLQRRSTAAAPAIRAVLRSIGGPDTDHVRLLVSQDIAQPFTFTWRRPVIVLPADLCESPECDAVRWCLAHEWAHVEGRHARAWLVAGLVRVLFFYQPLVWWLRAQLRLSQDYLADNRAACQAAEPEDYAQFLTSIMARGLTRFAGSGLAMAVRKSDLHRRVLMIIKNDAPLSRHCGRRWTWLTSAVVIAVVIAAAGYRLTPDDVKANESVAGSATGDVAVTPTRVAETTVKESSEADQNGVVKKEDLRYKGKSFQRWRWDLLTELDPESRKVAIKAIGVFSKNGLNKEAAETLVPMLEDSELHTVAFLELQKVGAVAIPALVKKLESDDADVRKYACYALKMGPAAKDALPHLAKLLSDEDLNVQRAACEAIGSIGGFDRSVEAKLVELCDLEIVGYRAIEALATITEPDTATIAALIAVEGRNSYSACLTLLQIGPPTKEVTEAIAQAMIKDLSSLLRLRWDSRGAHWTAIARGSGSSGKCKSTNVFPALIRVLELIQEDVGSTPTRGREHALLLAELAVKALEKDESMAVSAVPAMTALLLRTTKPQLQRTIMDVFQRLGPKAKEAIPAIKAKLAEIGPEKPSTWSGMQDRPIDPERLETTLRAIEGDAE